MCSTIAHLFLGAGFPLGLTKAVNGMLVLDVDDQVDWNKSHNTRDGRIVRRFNTNAKKYSFYNRTFKATVTVQKTQM